MRWLLLMMGCASDPCAGSCMLLTVTSQAKISVDTLQVSAAGALDGTRTAHAGKTLTLPAELPISLPAGATGTLSLFVEGLLGGQLMGSGSAELALASHASLDLEPDPPAPSLEEACLDQAYFRCQRNSDCSTVSPTFIERGWGDQATCEARAAIECRSEANAPGSRKNAAAVERCAAAYVAQACAERLAGFRPLPCIPSGTLALAEGCVFDSQCMGGFCRLALGEACGSCAEPTVAGVACAANSDCSGRQGCVMSLCTLKMPPAPVEVVASTDGHCGPKTVCLGGAGCFSGMCKGPAADGAACDPANGPTCFGPARCLAGVCRLPEPDSCR